MDKPGEIGGDHGHAEKVRLEILIRISDSHNDIVVKASESSLKEFYVAVGLLEQTKLRLLQRVEETGKKTGDFEEIDLNKPRAS